MLLSPVPVPAHRELSNFRTDRPSKCSRLIVPSETGYPPISGKYLIRRGHFSICSSDSLEMKAASGQPRIRRQSSME